MISLSTRAKEAIKPALAMVIAYGISHRVAGPAYRIRQTLEAYRRGETEIRARIREDETGAPSTSVGPTFVTAKPRSSPTARSSSNPPLRSLPIRKSYPATSARSKPFSNRSSTTCKCGDE